MAASYQLALFTVDVSNAVPMALTAGGEAFSAALRLARDLQNSRSDIVVEEDLALLFGRCRIESNIDSQFRAIVKKPAETTPWQNDIFLFDGAGPTVVRALTEKYYYSTVVQCKCLVSIGSFLVTEHETSSLAGVINGHYAKIYEGSPDSQMRRAIPSTELLRRTLRATEDQTSRFDWRAQLRAVATTLCLEDVMIHETIPPVIIRALLVMAPRVQAFPDEHHIDIETPQGACNLVVWVYTILGLTCEVTLNDGPNATRKIHFPPGGVSGSEQITIDARLHYPESSALQVPLTGEPTVTFYSTSQNDKLFTFRAEEEDEMIDSTLKGPAQGLASRVLNNAVPRKQSRDRVMKELAVVAYAWSLCIARGLFLKDLVEEFQDDFRPDGASEESQADDDDDPVPYHVSEDKVYDAWRFLFDLPEQKTHNLVEEYIVKYTNKCSFELVMPPAIERILKDWGPDGSWAEAESCWPRLRLMLHYIGALILAMAHVTDLRACATLALCEKIDVLARSDLCSTVAGWDGISTIMVQEDVWMQVLALMMMGQSGSDIDLQQLSLLSNRGWSMFVTTFGDADPSYADRGTITVTRGVPWRNGVWWHRVVDGSRPSRDHLVWQCAGSSGDTLTSLCTSKVSYVKPLVTERDERLEVTLRMSSERTGLQGTALAIKKIRRTGYNELWSALWLAVKTKPCTHPVKRDATLTLEPGWTALHDFGDNGCLFDLGDLRICLTANSSEARWRALISIRESNSTKIRVMLRGADTCYRCASTEAAAQPGKCYLIL